MLCFVIWQPNFKSVIFLFSIDKNKITIFCFIIRQGPIYDVGGLGFILTGSSRPGAATKQIKTLQKIFVERERGC